jgi:DNA helicase-2/ATP-dependent DNA helicase PcrA
LPYKVVGGTRFYERREVKDALAYLRVISNPADTVNLRRILNVPKRGIGDRAEGAVAALADRERIPFVAALGRVEDAPGIATRSVAAVKGFTALLEELGRVHEDDEAGVADLLEAILEKSGYLKELRASHDPQDETRIENLAELESVAREFETDQPEGTLSDFLERVSLVADSDEIPDAEEHGGVVTLMTLHTAKGLEFPVVFLTGMEDGVFPHQRSLGDRPELEEERRLAYVGLTRAEKRLYVSRALVRSAWGAPAHNPASRFLDELPDEVMDWRRTASEQTSWNRAVMPQLPTKRFGSATARADADARGQKREVPSLVAGDRVTHDSFGLGTVVAVEGAADKAVASIDFGSNGVKRLLLRYAPVEKL